MTTEKRSLQTNNDRGKKEVIQVCSGSMTFQTGGGLQDATERLLSSVQRKGDVIGRWKMGGTSWDMDRYDVVRRAEFFC